jgi:hypothetical protein
MVHALFDCGATWGIAMCFYCPSPFVAHCCGMNRSITNGGSRFDQFAGIPRISCSAILDCRQSPTSRRFGVVHTDLPQILKVAKTNFTAWGANEGSAVSLNESASQWTCRYLAGTFCIRVMRIESRAIVAPLIEFCNIDINSLVGL